LALMASDAVAFYSTGESPWKLSGQTGHRSHKQQRRRQRDGGGAEEKSGFSLFCPDFILFPQ
jgi:hypothetical protein